MNRVILIDNDVNFIGALSHLPATQNYDFICIPEEILRQATNNSYPAMHLAAWVNSLVCSASVGVEKTIVVINVNIKIEPIIRRSCCFGADILEAIRIHEFFREQHSEIQTIPILIYSWASPEYLLRVNPENKRLFSPGTVFLQLPFSPFPKRLFKAIDLALKKSGKINPDKFAPFFHSSVFFSKDRTRHSQANQFGVLVLMNTLEKIYTLLPEELCIKKHIGFKMPYPGSNISQLLFIYKRRLEEVDLKSEESLNIQVITNNLNEIEKNLSARRIALIDNEAASVEGLDSLGWKHAFEYLLLQEGVVDDLYAKVGHHAHKIADEVAVNKYACVLLDIRFPKDELGGKKNIKNTFGYQVLQAIRQKSPAIPVIVVTSINKAWRHRQLKEAGADAIWVKEGVDELRTPKESLYNIIRLLELIRRVTGAPYSFLYRSYRAFDDLKDKIIKRPNNIWWYGKTHWMTYNRKEKTPTNAPDHKIIIKILEDSFQLMRVYIRKIYLTFPEDPNSLLNEMDKRNTWEESEFAKMLIMNMAKAIEAVHGMKFEVDHRKRIKSNVIGGSWDNEKGMFNVYRGDWIAFWMYHLRNECAHYFPNIHYHLAPGKSLYDGRCAQNYMAFLLSYLSTEMHPFHSGKPKFYFKTKGDKKLFHLANSQFIKWLHNLPEISTSNGGIKEFFRLYHDIQKGLYASGD